MTVIEQPNLAAGTLAQKVFASHFTLVSKAGSIEQIVLDGAEGWTSPNPHPALSLMRWTTSHQKTAEAALEKVIERFESEGRGFDWMTGPRCEENGLLPLLERNGFISPSLKVAAMARSISPHYHQELPEGIKVRKVADTTDSTIWSIMARGFDVSSDVGAVFHDAYLTPSPLQRSDVYAATLDGSEQPIGVGYLSYIGDGPSVLLRVSSTLEQYRGRGVYSALVVERLSEAARNGRTQAFVHAYSQESQNCLLSLGFETVGTLRLHRWRP